MGLANDKKILRILRHLLEFNDYLILLFVSECFAGRYGDNCEEECGYCNGGSACNVLNGNCARPCQPGWEGNRCDKGKCYVYD